MYYPTLLNRAYLFVKFACFVYNQYRRTNMNNNRNKPEQLESTLKCTASAKCCKQVEKDLDRPDKSLASLLEEKQHDEDENDEQASD